jgi:glycosyltransferase involved in cell wall biosynthesis
MTLPSIASVIPCWNAEKWVGRAIESVLAQNYPDLDIIVIDDGSTDGSLDVIRSFGSRVRWETGHNRGACAARNAGLALAQSEYVLFLDADDYIEVPLLSSLARCAAYTSCDLAFGPSALEYPDGYRCSRSGFGETDTPISIFVRILGDDWVPLHSILWRRELVRCIGGWDERMVRNQDGELLGRALLKEPRLGFASDGCAVYVQHHDHERISSRRTPAAMSCLIDHVRRCALMIEGTAFSEHGRRALAQHAYDLARESYSLGYDDLGRHGLSLARELGLRRHQGPGMHKLAANVLGLRLAQTIARVTRRMIEART